MDEGLKFIRSNVAGIDVGSRKHYASAYEGDVQSFSTYTSGCMQLRDYLLSMGIKTVAMESTGVYWIVLYAILEEAGLEVYLVNGRNARNMPGRKTDAKDCQWIRQLHGCGLLTNSFIPGKDYAVIRSYWRLRQDHIRAAATQVHLMQKALTQMNIRLTETISDIVGVSGLRMIEAIIQGVHDPEALLELCVEQLKVKKGVDIKEALRGYYREEHIFALSQALSVWKYYNKLIEDCEKKIDEKLNSMVKKTTGQEKCSDQIVKKKRKPIRTHKPKINELPKKLLTLTDGKDPIEIPGITDSSFLSVISEIGVDMSPWKTVKHFTSWLNLTPKKASSGRMKKKVRLTRHNNAGQIFRTIAESIIQSKHLALGAFGRRIRYRHGSAVAIKAVARKIASYYYWTMKYGNDYVEQGIEIYERKQKEQVLKSIQKKALEYNMKLVNLSEPMVMNC